jgi:hypothetical protein
MYIIVVSEGLPIFSTGGVKRRPLSELFEPSVYTPRSRYVRDPWWWEYPHLKPYTPISSSYRPPAKSYLRDSYLSPVKRTYLWGHHPIRLFSEYIFICITMIIRIPYNIGDFVYPGFEVGKWGRILNPRRVMEFNPVVILVEKTKRKITE